MKDTSKFNRTAFAIASVLFLFIHVFVTPVYCEVLTTSAIPVAKGEILAGTRLMYASVSDDPSPAGAKIEALENNYAFAYGLTEKVTLGVYVPIQYLKLEFNTPAGRASFDATGLGDIGFGVRYTAYQWDAPGKTFRVTPYVFSTAPTGDDDNQEPGFGRSPLQLGSGAWSPQIGFSAIYQTLDWQIEGSFEYIFHTEANDFQAGDTFQSFTGIFYRIWPREFSERGNFYFGVEAQWRFDQVSEVSGVEIPDSDRSGVIPCLVLQYRASGLKVSVFGGVPAWEDANTAVVGPKTDYTIGSVVMVSF